MPAVSLTCVFALAAPCIHPLLAALPSLFCPPPKLCPWVPSSSLASVSWNVFTSNHFEKQQGRASGSQAPPHMCRRRVGWPANSSAQVLPAAASLLATFPQRHIHFHRIQSRQRARRRLYAWRGRRLRARRAPGRCPRVRCPSLSCTGRRESSAATARPPRAPSVPSAAAAAAAPPPPHLPAPTFHVPIPASNPTFAGLRSHLLPSMPMMLLWWSTRRCWRLCHLQAVLPPTRSTPACLQHCSRQ